MGKELATVDRLGVKVGKVTIPTNLFDKADVNELYTPAKNAKEISEAISKTFNFLINFNGPLFGLGTAGSLATAVFGAMNIFAGTEPLGILLTTLGVFGIGGTIALLPLLEHGDNMLAAVKETNGKRLVEWIEERYSLTIRDKDFVDFWNAANGQVDADGQQFFATDNKEYRIRKTVEGQLFVEPVAIHTITASEAKKLEAVKALPESQDFADVEPAVAALLNSIKSDAAILSGYSLPIEQQHVVGRAVEEATRAVVILQKMRNLEPDASSVETVDILSLVSVELSAIKKSVMNDLMKELKSVNDYRKHEATAA